MSSSTDIPFHKFYKLLYDKNRPNFKDIVIATVKDIQPHGIYVHLDEFGSQAYCPINELSTKWVKKPSDLVRINQKIVAQVYKITHRGRVINVSLKRVLPGERKRKLLEWKRLVRSLMIFRLIAEKVNAPLEEVILKVGRPLADEFGNPYYGMEEVIKEGKEILESVGIPEEWIDDVYEIIKQNVKPSEVELKKVLIVRTFAPDGINRIKSGFEKALKIAPKNITVEYLSAPRYLVKIKGYEWKEVDKIFKKLINTIENSIKDDKKWKAEVYIEGEEKSKKRRKKQKIK
ncbi:MAG: translation initiation factor IF-2 subunit alpha [Candidatus Njordarchaeia archaeon]